MMSALSIGHGFANTKKKSNYNGEGRVEKRKTSEEKRKENQPSLPSARITMEHPPLRPLLMDSRDSPIGHLGSLPSVALPLRGA